VLGGDPRRPQDAKRFPRAAAGADDSALDTYFLVSMFVGLAGFILKVRGNGRERQQAQAGASSRAAGACARRAVRCRRGAGRLAPAPPPPPCGSHPAGVHRPAAARSHPPANALPDRPPLIRPAPQHKLLSWAAVFICAAGLANVSANCALQHITSSIAFSIMGLAATYAHTGPTGLAALFPPPRPAAPAAATEGLSA
jgi:hypothetical protein